MKTDKSNSDSEKSTSLATVPLETLVENLVFASLESRNKKITEEAEKAFAELVKDFLSSAASTDCNKSDGTVNLTKLI